MGDGRSLDPLTSSLFFITVSWMVEIALVVVDLVMVDMVVVDLVVVDTRWAMEEALTR